MNVLNEDRYILDKIEYLSSTALRPRWKNLCNNLKNNLCIKKASFKKGEHSLIIRSKDNAGNRDIRNLDFIID